jgi:hypothetical protein
LQPTLNPTPVVLLRGRGTSPRVVGSRGCSVEGDGSGQHFPTPPEGVEVCAKRHRRDLDYCRDFRGFSSFLSNSQLLRQPVTFPQQQQQLLLLWLLDPFCDRKGFLFPGRGVRDRMTSSDRSGRTSSIVATTELTTRRRRR